MKRTCATIAGCWILLAPILALGSPRAAGPRRTICLDGTWQVAQGSMDNIPAVFDRTAPVPGLADMAEPEFGEVGIKSDKRKAFWYRRTFTLDADAPAIALLKIHKGKFGKQVYLNGALVGEHLPCFTPGYFDVQKHLKPAGQENELIVRIGAFFDVLPPTVRWGNDYEKRRYLPGIYDSVELILAGAPFIRNLQIVPEIRTETVRVVADIHNIENADEITARYRIREAATGTTVAEGAVSESHSKGFRAVPLDFRVSIESCKLWSPESPFLYELELVTAGDGIRQRFGMRSFRFDGVTGRAILNDKPYFLRGSNVCIFRFFEDPERGSRPWDKQWVRRLHRAFKGMHWNSLRYCIGFPPDFWYDIADEEGILIQDEYPVWGWKCLPRERPVECLAAEYREWMEERWNHPCVVIWDAQNETRMEETGAALTLVRNLDLSDRPWDNGWGEPQHPDDCQEVHPYLFNKLKKQAPPESGPLSEKLTELVLSEYTPRAKSGRKLNNPVIINEYAYLWLNRDGTTTTLTDSIYRNCFPDADTTDERRYHYARWLAALTEYWRAHRRCAGILHFCGLAYSRSSKPRGQTSDHFIDLDKLTFEPMFKEYVGDAFAPVGLMVNYWNSRTTGGSDATIEVYVVNDLEAEWRGQVQFRVERSGKVLQRESRTCSVDGYGREIISFDVSIPAEQGKYKLLAQIKGAHGETVTSFRDVEVIGKHSDLRNRGDKGANE